MTRRHADSRTLLTFAVGERQCAVETNGIEQIVPLPEVTTPPQAPPLLYGFLDLAGEPVPVIRLQRLFHLPETSPGLWAPLVIVRDVDRQLALLVDRVNQVVDVADEAVLPLPDGHALNDCVDGIWRSSAGPVLLLSPQRLLLQQENERLTELKELARGRIKELAGTPS